uniref:Calmodulin-binding domain-containing protein n=1 Tax=Manihot esculenta TaxID=3983 RepID=A0A2C9UY95_MANES
MVQRKVAVKLGVQADHVKSEKRLGNLKPSPYQHHDGKNRGLDMKKKMKKSGSIKLSDIESLNASPLRKTMSRPGMSLSRNASTIAATPQKQQLMLRTSGGSPNYMKATSSSEARNERSQVSFFNTPTASDITNPHRRNSSNLLPSSASSNRLTRALTKSSSLKLVRTLTKTPSFKPARSSAKKCSSVVLCADMNVQKATCSSTLKDSKFPEYIMLNPGGTEAEGTSVLKVCPYNYCSLNGYNHTPLPPLKYFLKARRRSLKAHKSVKSEGLSPRTSDGTEEISSQLLILSDDKSPSEEEVGVDFFVEIYAKNIAVCPDATEKHIGKDVGTIGFAGEPNKCSSHGGQEEGAEQDNMKEVDQNLSDASPQLETDFEKIYGQSNYNHLVEIWTAEDFLQEKEDVSGDYAPILSQESRKERCASESHIEGECQISMEEYDNISEATDMQWEEGQFSTSGSDIEAQYLGKSYKKSCTDVECLSDIKKFNLTDEPEIIRSADIISNCTEEILADEVLQEFFGEETASFDIYYIGSDSETEGMLQNWETETTQDDGYLTYDDAFEYAFEEPTTVEEKSEDAEKDLTAALTASASMEELIMESAAVNENIQEDGIRDAEHFIFEKNPQLRDAEYDCSTNVTTEALNGYQEGKSLQVDDTIELIQDQIASCQSLDEMGNTEKNEGQISRETETDQNLEIRTCATEEQEEVVKAKSSMGIQISYSCHSSSEADQYDSVDNDNQTQIIAEACWLDKISEASSSSEELLNQNSLAKYGQNENLNLFREDQGGANESKIETSTDTEEQSDSRMHQTSLARHHIGEVEKMEVAVCNQSDIAETVFATDDGIRAGSESKFFSKGSNSGQELASSFNNRKWTVNCKKPIMDLEEERKFNPREPNFLPIAPDPEVEKVDLRHQIMDDRKSAEEWMLDYALRQAVTKLAPARKRKVALLVEAFETILPIPKYGTQIRPASAAFSHTRPIQACS